MEPIPTRRLWCRYTYWSILRRSLVDLIQLFVFEIASLLEIFFPSRFRKIKFLIQRFFLVVNENKLSNHFDYELYIFFTLVFPVHDSSSLDHVNFTSTSFFYSLLLSFLFLACDELNCGTKHLSCLLESVYKHRITLVYFHDDIFSFSPRFSVLHAFLLLVVRNIGFAYNAQKGKILFI